MSRKNKILILVEGEKREVKMMNKMLSIYDLSDIQIVSYGANIYNLYKDMFEDKNPEDYDLLQVLKSRENDYKKKEIFDQYYSDILLIFDLDPQDSSFQQENLIFMQGYFSESSDNGKLYINYPMVESFYHMKSIPDSGFPSRFIAFDKVNNYKHIVSRETVISFEQSGYESVPHGMWARIFQTCMCQDSSECFCSVNCLFYILLIFL